jgi:hypothetical protein
VGVAAAAAAVGVEAVAITAAAAAAITTTTSGGLPRQRTRLTRGDVVAAAYEGATWERGYASVGKWGIVRSTAAPRRDTVAKVLGADHPPAQPTGRSLPGVTLVEEPPAPTARRRT